MSYSIIIKKLLESQPDRKFYSYELSKVRTDFGWIGSSGDRRARELAEKGLINRSEKDGYAVYWHKRYAPVFTNPKQLSLV